MFANIMITDYPDTSFRYVQFSVKHGILFFRALSGADKRSCKIPLSDIRNISMDDYMGSSRINFEYHGLKYAFLETGNGSLNYLKSSITQNA